MVNLAVNGSGFVADFYSDGPRDVPLHVRDVLPPVLASPSVVGKERSQRLFDNAYDEHARRVGRALAAAGQSTQEEEGHS